MAYISGGSIPFAADRKSDAPLAVEEATRQETDELGCFSNDIAPIRPYVAVGLCAAAGLFATYAAIKLAKAGSPR